MQHAELRCKGGVGSKVGWSKALNKTVDYRVDSQAKVGMRERGFKEEGIREEMETEGGGGSQGAKGKRDKQNESTRQDRELWWGVGRAGRPWDEEPAGTRQGQWSDELEGGRWGEHLGWRSSRAGGRPDGSSRSCLAGQCSRFRPVTPL